MSYLIDTNILLEALVRSTTAKGIECVSLLKALSERRVRAFLPGLVLAEVGWTLRSFYKLTRPEVAQTLMAISVVGGCSLIDDYDYPSALELYRLSSIKYVDACIACVRVSNDDMLSVISYDQDFDKIGMPRVEPRDVLKRLE